VRLIELICQGIKGFARSPVIRFHRDHALIDHQAGCGAQELLSVLRDLLYPTDDSVVRHYLIDPDTSGNSRVSLIFTHSAVVYRYTRDLLNKRQGLARRKGSAGPFELMTQESSEIYRIFEQFDPRPSRTFFEEVFVLDLDAAFASSDDGESRFVERNEMPMGSMLSPVNDPHSSPIAIQSDWFREATHWDHRERAVQLRLLQEERARHEERRRTDTRIEELSQEVLALEEERQRIRSDEERHRRLETDVAKVRYVVELPADFEASWINCETVISGLETELEQLTAALRQLPPQQELFGIVPFLRRDRIGAATVLMLLMTPLSLIGNAGWTNYAGLIVSIAAIAIMIWRILIGLKALDAQSELRRERVSLSGKEKVVAKRLRERREMLVGYKQQSKLDHINRFQKDRLTYERLSEQLTGLAKKISSKREVWEHGGAAAREARLRKEMDELERVDCSMQLEIGEVDRRIAWLESGRAEPAKETSASMAGGTTETALDSSRIQAKLAAFIHASGMTAEKLQNGMVSPTLDELVGLLLSVGVRFDWQQGEIALRSIGQTELPQPVIDRLVWTLLWGRLVPTVASDYSYPVFCRLPLGGRDIPYRAKIQDIFFEQLRGLSAITQVIQLVEDESGRLADRNGALNGLTTLELRE